MVYENLFHINILIVYWDYYISTPYHESYYPEQEQIISISLAWTHLHIDGLVQEKRNSIANALELRLFCINPSICSSNPFRAGIMSKGM